jgi:hypothetical protein
MSLTPKTDAARKEERRRDLATAWRYLLAVSATAVIHRAGVALGVEWLQRLADVASSAAFGVLFYAVSKRDELTVASAGVTVALIAGLVSGLVTSAIAVVAAIRLAPEHVLAATGAGASDALAAVLLSPLAILGMWLVRRWLRRPALFAAGYLAFAVALGAFVENRASHVSGVVEFDGHMPVREASVFVDDGTTIHEFHTDSAGRFSVPVDRFRRERYALVICAPGLTPVGAASLRDVQLGVSGYSMTRRTQANPPVVGWMKPLPPGC